MVLPNHASSPPRASGGLLDIFGGPWLAAVSLKSLLLSSQGTCSLSLSLLTRTQVLLDDPASMTSS